MPHCYCNTIIQVVLASDTRRALETMKQPLPKRMTRGHIPGSKNLPYELLVDPDTALMHSKEELLECKYSCFDMN